MNVAVFDGYEAVRELEAAGVERSHAGVMVKTMIAVSKAHREDLTTKADFAELKTEFAAAVNRMLLGQIAVAGALFAAIALLFAALKFF